MTVTPMAYYGGKTRLADRISNHENPITTK